MKRRLAAALFAALCGAPASAQQPPLTPTANVADKGQILLTIFFKHDQAKTLDEINEQLKRRAAAVEQRKKMPGQ
ncbi:MAG: hypothetical protein NVSMB26_02420 [Beijerinckiaceae bacterium]